MTLIYFTPNAEKKEIEANEIEWTKYANLGPFNFKGAVENYVVDSHLRWRFYRKGSWRTILALIESEDEHYLFGNMIYPDCDPIAPGLDILYSSRIQPDFCVNIRNSIFVPNILGYTHENNYCGAIRIHGMKAGEYVTKESIKTMSKNGWLHNELEKVDAFYKLAFFLNGRVVERGLKGGIALIREGKFHEAILYYKAGLIPESSVEVFLAHLRESYFHQTKTSNSFVLLSCDSNKFMELQLGHKLPIRLLREWVGREKPFFEFEYGGLIYKKQLHPSNCEYKTLDDKSVVISFVIRFSNRSINFCLIEISIYPDGTISTPSKALSRDDWSLFRGYAERLKESMF